MPFNQLVNAQQIEAVVAGPGDANRLYVCKGLAQGTFGVKAEPNESADQNDLWQFEVGPQLDAGQFRRAIATCAFAGFAQVSPAEGADITVSITQVFADFDDDQGKVRVSATTFTELFNRGTTAFEFEKITTLAYDVSILAAVS